MTDLQLGFNCDNRWR